MKTFRGPVTRSLRMQHPLLFLSPQNYTCYSSDRNEWIEQGAAMSNNENKSIGWIVRMSVLLVAYLAWGFMAGSYAGSDGGADGFIGRGRIGAAAMLISSIYSFVITSITQLPKFFTVISWHFSNRIWLPILFIVLEIGVIAGGYGLKRLEDSLEGNSKKRKR